MPEHDHDFGSIRLHQARRESVTQLVRREVLILDIDIAFRRVDSVQVERADLVDRRLAFEDRHSSRDTDIDIGEGF